MFGMIVRLVMLGLIVYLIYSFYRKVIRPLKDGVFGAAIPMNRAETCPSCRERIRVPKEPGSCPRCGITLGRSPDGKLLIKIN